MSCSSGYTAKSPGTTPAGRQHAGKCAAPSPANAYSRFLSARSSTEPATSDPAADENGLKAVQSSNTRSVREARGACLPQGTNDLVQEGGKPRAASSLKTCNTGRMHFLLRNEIPRQLVAPIAHSRRNSLCARPLPSRNGWTAFISPKK